MPTPSLSPDTLQTFALMVEDRWWQLEPPPALFWQEIQRAIASEQPGSDHGSPPVDVIGRPAPHAALPFHRNALARLCRCAPLHPLRHRLAYHADWILSLLTDGSGPLVSVIIPVFNRSDSITEAVNSCLAQTYSNLEILVIDDGSSEDITTALQPVLEHILLLRQETNRGAGAARNLGIEQASGSLIHFLDSDDRLDPDAIARKIAALRAISDADLVFSGARQIEATEASGINAIRPCQQPPPRAEHCPTQGLLNTICRQDPFLTSTVLVARWRLLEAGLFDPDLRRGEDEELFLRLALRRIKVVGINGLTTLRRRSGQSLTANPISRLERSHDHLRCLISLLETPGRGGRCGLKLLRRHLRATSLPALVADRSAASDRLREDLRTALEAMVREAGAGSPKAAALLAGCQRQLRAVLTQCPQIRSDPWVQTLGRLSRLPTDPSPSRDEPCVRTAPAPGIRRHQW